MANRQWEKPVFIEWGKKGNISSQNNMSNPSNIYNHNTLPNNAGDENIVDTKATTATSTAKNSNFRIIKRGNTNHAPQMDLELGKRSITHSSIANKLADLVAGDGIVFIPVIDDNSTSTEIEEANLQLEIANEWLALGLQAAIKTVANGLVYGQIASITISQNPPIFKDVLNKVTPTPKRFTARKGAELRLEMPRMNKYSEEIYPRAFFHKDWLFKESLLNACDDYKDYGGNVLAMPNIVDIESYITMTNEEKFDDTYGFWTYTTESEFAKTSRFITHIFRCKEGVFDGAYPLPRWKSNSSINDIQNEFEASSLRTDYLQNGMHIYAVVNVYSSKFINSEVNNNDAATTWDNALAMVDNLKGSFNSGRVLVNPVRTDKPEMDGKIEIEKVELPFPVESIKYFNEESRSAILTAWGVAPDPFGITKPEKSNFVSQAGFIEMAIIFVNEKVQFYQQPIIEELNWLLNYYGLNKVKATIKKAKSNAFLVAVRDFAKDFMPPNEVRTELLGLGALSQEQLDTMNTEKQKAAGTYVEPTALPPQ
jgi:hypothetical protein